MGIDGRIFPAAAAPKKAAAAKGETAAFEEFLDHWYPIQVKGEKVSRGKRCQEEFLARLSVTFGGWH